MISFATRGLLLSLGLVLASAFVARPVQAGGVLWTGTICTDPVTVSGNFSGSFFGVAKCEAICKIAAGVCRGAVKDALSCSKDSMGSLLKAMAVVCGTLEGAEKADCLANLKESKLGLKEELAADRTIALANCAGFLDNCIDGCSMPPE